MQTKHKGESPSMARFASVTRNEREALEFQAKGASKNACCPFPRIVGKTIFVDI